MGSRNKIRPDNKPNSALSPAIVLMEEVTINISRSQSNGEKIIFSQLDYLLWKNLDFLTSTKFVCWMDLKLLYVDCDIQNNLFLDWMVGE